MSLPRKVASRVEHTGDLSLDRAQKLAVLVTAAHEQTKAVVSGFMAVTNLTMYDQNQTLTPAQLAKGAIIATGTLTAARTLSGFTRPTSTDGSDWYWRLFWNNTTGGFNVTLSDGTSTLAVGAGGQDAVVFTNTGPKVLR